MPITKITIGRLYNLGNYEHVRYELSVEVPEGQSAATAVIGMEKILSGLAPLKHANVKSQHDIQQMAREIEAMKTMSVVDWERRYGLGTGSDLIERKQDLLEEESVKTQAALTRARRARQLFDDLGGAAQWKDAKLDWDDYDGQDDEC